MTRGALLVFAILCIVQALKNAVVVDGTATTTAATTTAATTTAATTTGAVAGGGKITITGDVYQNNAPVTSSDQTLLDALKLEKAADKALCDVTKTMFDAEATITGSWKSCTVESVAGTKATVSITVDTTSLTDPLNDYTSKDFLDKVKDAINRGTKPTVATAYYFHPTVQVQVAVTTTAATTDTVPIPTSTPANYKTVFIVGDVYQGTTAVTLTEPQRTQSTVEHAALEKDLCDQAKIAFQTNKQIANAWHGCAIDEATASKVTLAVSFDADVLKAQNVDYKSADFMEKIAAAVKATSVPSDPKTYYFYMNVEVHGSAMVIVPSLTILMTTGLVCVLNFGM